MIVIHNGRPHTYVTTHKRGDSTVVGHWRAVPSTYPDDPAVIGTERQGFAPFTNPEPVELFGGKTS
jgi:hypothetical protein